MKHNSPIHTEDILGLLDEPLPPIPGGEWNTALLHKIEQHRNSGQRNSLWHPYVVVLGTVVMMNVGIIGYYYARSTHAVQRSVSAHALQQILIAEGE